MYLEKIDNPEQLKQLTIDELKIYASEVRSLIIDVVLKNGGHLASNLGVVDLTIAMHYVFDCPNDKLLFDVGHQSYAHKIITGRRDKFHTLRTSGGITGFENSDESIYDAFSMGHSSTSLSVALGLARARDLDNKKHNIVSVIGDGAMTGGEVFEAINDVGSSKSKIIIVLNDNEMSISKNVGAMSTYFNKLRLSKKYKSINKTLKEGVEKLPFIGKALRGVFSKAKRIVRRISSQNKIFEQLGVKYYGVFDGHNIKELVGIFEKVKLLNEPAMVHLITKKGVGYKNAEQDPETFHNYDLVANSTNEKMFSKVVSSTLVDVANQDKKIVAISAAMIKSTGLFEFNSKYPKRCFDVGIAEAHAITMASGLAKGGYKPYVCIYSTFLQRGVDQIIHDVCLTSQPVKLLIDRAGQVGKDGATHQGVFDLTYLSMCPNMTVLAPINGAELEMMIKWSVNYNYPLAIRYQKSYKDVVADVGDNPLKWVQIKSSKSNKYVFCVGGRMFDIAKNIDECNVVNCRSVKPLDVEYLDSIPDDSLIITMEDNVIRGGFGQSVLAYFANRNIKVITLGYKDEFIHELDINKVLKINGLTEKNIQDILNITH